ncbi:cache domain-containing protein [Crassaminicella thermophila]|nr:cache domain-containing protein [Crassaminicella thermophila]
MNISHKFVLLFIIGCIVAFSLMGIFYLDHSRSIINNQYIESFDSSIIQLNNSISEFFSNFENALDMFSKNEMVQKVSDDPEKYYIPTMQFFKSFQQSYSSTAFAYFAPNKIILKNKKLITWPDTSDVLANTDWTASKRPWYKNAVKANGKIAWTKPYIDATTKKPIITISKVVKNSKGQLKGVMAIDFFLDELSNKIENFKAFKQGYAFVIDKDRSGYIFIVKDMQNRKFDKIIKADWMKRVFEKKSGSLNIKENNTDYYVTYTTNEITGWKVLGIIEKEKVYKNTRDMMQKIFTSSLIIMSIGILTIAYIAKQMTKSIKDLRESINDNENINGDDLPNQFNSLLKENQNYESLIDESSAYMSKLFECQWELENLMDIVKNKIEESYDIEIFRNLENIIDKLINFRNQFESSKSKLYQLQKENIQNHMDLVVEKIKERKNKHIPFEINEILNRIEKKIFIKDIEN